jgi:hypothetical protein
MATTTPNFGWPVPTSTDLVKDGATAIEALGDGIDTSMVDLKGGLTGQVLAKATNADMDFSWVAQDDSNAIQNAIVDAKGDLIGATAADTPARLAVGTNGQVLTADSTASTGLAWAAPAGYTLISSTALSGASVNLSSIPQTYRFLKLVVSGMLNSTGNGNFTIKHNGFSDSWYYSQNMRTTLYTYNNSFYQTAANMVRTDGSNVFTFDFDNYSQLTNMHGVIGSYVFVDSGGSVQSGSHGGALFVSGGQITSLQLANTGGNFSAGTALLYGGN